MANHMYAPNKHERWVRQIADEVAEILAHGGRGSFEGLCQHLSIRFGTIEPHDVRQAISLLPAWTKAEEKFQ